MYRKVMPRIEADPNIDIILMIGSLTDDEGVRILKNLRSNHRLCDLPVVVADSHFNQSLVAQLNLLKVNDILVLPTNRETAMAKINRAAAEGRKTVLVVDDEPTILDVLSHFLRFERFRSLTAGSAEQAEKTLRTERVDLVVADIGLPGKSGLDLLIHVKEQYPFIPVILITGNAGKYGSKEAIAMGADGFFAKPFNNLELVYTLRGCLLRYASGTRRPANIPQVLD
jgi:DNA-binding response OmpR family regulator